MDWAGAGAKKEVNRIMDNMGTNRLNEWFLYLVWAR